MAQVPSGGATLPIIKAGTKARRSQPSAVSRAAWTAGSTTRSGGESSACRQSSSARQPRTIGLQRLRLRQPRIVIRRVGWGVMQVRSRKMRAVEVAISAGTNQPVPVTQGRNAAVAETGTGNRGSVSLPRRFNRDHSISKPASISFATTSSLAKNCIASEDFLRSVERQTWKSSSVLGSKGRMAIFSK